MTVLLRDDFTGSGTLLGRTPDGVHTGTWSNDSYFGGTASNTSITGGVLVPLPSYQFGASIALAGSPTNAYIEAALLTSDVTYPVGAKSVIGLGTTIGSAAAGVFCAFTRTTNVFGDTNLDLDLTYRHSDFASGTTSTSINLSAGSASFKVRLEVQGTAVLVYVNESRVMDAVLNAPMAAGRAFIGSEFADTTFDWVQAGFLPTFVKPPLLNLTGTVLLDLFSGSSNLQYQAPEFVAGAFTGQTYYFYPANRRENGWVSGGDVLAYIAPSYGGGAPDLTQVTVDLIFRTSENGLTAYLTSVELLKLYWKYPSPNVETYDVSLIYLIGADAITQVGGGAVAGFYLKSSHYAPTAGVAVAVNRYTLLPTLNAEEVHHIRVDQFRSTSQSYYFDDVLVDTTSNPTAGGTHKLSEVGFNCLLGADADPIFGGVRVMTATSFSGPPFFWRDLITCVETR